MSFESQNQENAQSKTRAGTRPINYLKSSTFLPRVFQNPLNRKWLDATLDRMISKGDLEDIEAFVGSNDGRDIASINDNYLVTGNNDDYQLEPAIVARDDKNEISHVLSVDNIARSIAMEFDTYSYNAAYNTQAYVYNPPIDLDKFVNFSLYYWVPDFPTLVLNNVSDVNQNPIDKLTGAPFGSLQDQILDSENNSTGEYRDIILSDGMKIQFVGAGWSEPIRDKTYVVGGVGTSMRFQEYSLKAFNNIVPYVNRVSGEFLPLETLDYIVVNRAEKIASAWARGNHWMHRDVIRRYQELGESLDIAEYLTLDRQAKRPIIEFDADIALYNHGKDYGENDVFYHGTVDYLLAASGFGDDEQHINADLGIDVGATVVFKLDSVEHQQQHQTVYIVGENNEIIPDESTGGLFVGNTLTVINDRYSGDSRFRHTDFYFYDGQLTPAQNKTSANQPPLFRLKDSNGKWLEDFTNTTFTGNKIFGYKESTSTTVDPELGFSLAYKSTGSKSEILFDNFICTRKYSFLDINSNVETTIPGLYFYEKSNKNYNSYIPAAYTMGAKEHYQVIADGSTDVELPVGYNNWRVEKEFLVFEKEGTVSVTEILSEGVYNRTRQNQPDLVLGKNETYTFHDLIGSGELRFFNTDGDDVELSGDPDVTVVRSGADIDVTFPDVEGFVLYYGTNTSRGRIVTNQSQDEFFHKVFLDGVYLNMASYSVQADKIVIPASSLKENSVVDIEFYNSDTDHSTEHTHVPEVHSHNSRNRMIEDLTIGETIEHWTSLITSAPNFEGLSYGGNNYHDIMHVKNYGGEIFIHDDLSIMHDISYAIPEMNITQALQSQGKDWAGFQKRIVSQVKRLYKSKKYSAISDLTNETINALTQIRKGTELNRDSNMLYGHKNTAFIFDYNEDNVYEINTNINVDLQKRDHVYVYMADNSAGDNRPVEKILSRVTDYRFINGQIHVYVTPTQFTNGLKPQIKVYYHQMDEDSYVPSSMAKLGLTHLYHPQILNNTIYRHDGSVYKFNAGADLFDVDSENFDPVAAVIYDIEQRIWAGIITPNQHGANSFAKYLPSQHRGTWYTRQKLDNFLHRFFAEWYRTSGYISLTTPDYYDELDPFTWNYSELTLDQGHFEGNLPGSWAGAYYYIFGTDTPHITPWHMLGYSAKPAWWDDHYSWTDPVKRTALIAALNLGIINSPDDTHSRQDIRYARYYWDFENKSPVDITGELVAPNLVLGDPSAQGRLAEFKFGDWGPVEILWRKSALGQAAMIDAVVKMNPTQAWTDFFEPNIYDRNDSITDMVLNHYNMMPITPASIQAHGFEFKKRVKDVRIERSSGYFPEGTAVKFVGGTEYIQAQAILHIDGDGRPNKVTMTDRGTGYTSQPNVVVEFPVGWEPNDAKNNGVWPEAVFKVDLSTNYNYRLGISQVLSNYKIRNNYDISITSVYRRLKTQLLQLMGGYTSREFLQIEAESSATGKFTVGEKDATVVMYGGYPEEMFLASEIYITKTDSGYVINGYSKHRQEFKFYEPIIDNNFKTISISDTQTVKQYKTFNTNKVSVLQFGTKLARIQDVYNFIRGYYAYLEGVGYRFKESYESKAIKFTSWAITADIDTIYTVELGTSVWFDREDSVVMEYGSIPGHVNTIMTYNENGEIVEISYSDLCITRSVTEIQIHPRVGSIDVSEPGESIVRVVNTTTPTVGESVTSTITSVTNTNEIRQSSTNTQYETIQGPDVVSTVPPSGRNIVSILTGITKFQHAVLFENLTQFNQTLFNDIKNIRQPRLKITGQRTRDWSGAKSAPGYLVKDNSIVQNFDTVVEDIVDFYDLNVAKFNSDISQAEKMTVGNYTRDWIQSLGLPTNVVNKFYQGVIKKKGTNSVIDRLARTNIINQGRSEISMSEEWMFRMGGFGDTTREHATEIEINSDMITDDPTIIDFNSNDLVYVNNSSVPKFDTASYNDLGYRLYTGGDVMLDETDYIVKDINELETVFDRTADYAVIPTWNSKTSYKLNDQVRRMGNLYKCNVPYIGFQQVINQIDITGSIVVTDTLFVHRNEVEDPTTPSVTIDGYNIWFDKTKLAYPNIVADTVADPIIASDTSLVVDSTYTVNFGKYREETVVNNSDVHDGNPYATQSVSFTAVPDVTGETLIIDGVVLELDTFVRSTESQVINGNDIDNVFALTGHVTNSSTPIDDDYYQTTITVTPTADYTIDLDAGTITFDTAPASGDTFTLTYTYGLSRNNLKDAINSVAGVQAMDYELEINRVAIVKPVADEYDINLTLVIGNGSANSVLGYTAGTYTPSTMIQTVPEDLDVNDIKAQLRAALPVSQYGVEVTVDNKVRIEKYSTDAFNANTVLIFAGNARTVLGFDETYFVGTPAQVGVGCTATEAVQYINDAEIPGVSATVVSGRINLISNNITMTVTETEFSQQAGIQTGVYETSDIVYENKWVPSQWTQINSQDPALFNVWVLNDSAYARKTTSDIASRFESWNIFQVQRFRMWAEIDAGNESDDGNDAKLTFRGDDGVIKPVPLRAGDKIMIVGSTTTPNIDGIHTVTARDEIDQTGSIAYIDRFIEKSGTCSTVYVIRNARFADNAQVQETLLLPEYYNWNEGDLAWSTADISGNKSTNVFKYTSGAFQQVRFKNDIIKNELIENIRIYDAMSQKTVIELEVFDPLNNIIPGVVSREIDSRHPFDIAVYNMSTDQAYTVNERNAWGDNELGKVWWDTSKVRYYDYTQGPYEYNAKMWGKQVPGSSIDVYEWTKSTVPPDEWEDQVKSAAEHFGFVASGDVYRIYDAPSDSYLYYYTEDQEWNAAMGRYDTVYYFWVKNKNTIGGENRILTVSDIARIIDNPTANGIAWCAALSSDAFVVNNVSAYINDVSSVMQINITPAGIEHNNWVKIAENVDLIPDYLYIGLDDNLLGRQRVTGLPLPDNMLHEYNRYGDSRALVYNNRTHSQAWFKDPWDARREVISIINRLLRSQNLYDDLGGKWDRILANVFYILTEDTQVGTELPTDPAQGDTFYNSALNKMYNYTGSEWVENPGYDMRKTWSWATYVAPERQDGTYPSLEVSGIEELLAVDPAEYDLVKVNKPLYADGLDRSEVYAWTGLEWMLVEKNNATIEFNDIVWAKNPLYNWDMQSWEGIWDFDTSPFIGWIIKACREDLFIEKYINNFNKMFFGMVKYTASLHNQVDWFYKTTYIRLDIDTYTPTTNILSELPRKYYRDTLAELSGYVNTVKPFHTKISNVVDKYRMNESTNISIQELDRQFDITLNYGFPDYVNPTYELNGDLIDGQFSDVLEDEYFGGGFTDELDDELYVGEFNEVFNWDSDIEEVRRTEYKALIQESVALRVMTNTSNDIVDADTRSFAYLIDGYENVAVYGLLESKASVVLECDVLNNRYKVQDAAPFNPTGGWALVEGEVIHYMAMQTVGTDVYLEGVTRRVGYTLDVNYSTQRAIHDITDTYVTGNNPFTKIWQPETRVSDVKFDVYSGESLVSPTATSLEAITLRVLGKGDEVAKVF